MQNIAILQKPVISEKTALEQEKKIYTFWVSKNATKIDVKKAIKSLYGVDVQEVRIINTTSKTRKIKKGVMTKRSEQKKALVVLKNRAELDMTKFTVDKEKEKKVKISTKKVTRKNAK